MGRCTQGTDEMEVPFFLKKTNKQTKPSLSCTSVHQLAMVFPQSFFTVCLSVCVCLPASQGWGCLFRGIRDSAGLLSFYSGLTASSNLDQKVPTPTHPQLHQQHCSLSIYFEGKTCVRDAQTHTWVLRLVSNSQMWVYMAVLLWWHGKRKEMVDLSE